MSKQWTIAVAAFVVVALGLSLSLYFPTALSARNTVTTNNTLTTLLVTNSDTSSNTPMAGYNPATDPSRTVLPGYDYLVYFDSSTGHIDSVETWNATELSMTVHGSNSNATCPVTVSTATCVNVYDVATKLFRPGPGNRSIIDVTGSPYLQQVLTSSYSLSSSNPYLPYHVDLSTKQIVPGYVQ